MRYIVTYLQNNYEHWIKGFELAESLIEAEKVKDFHNHYRMGKTIHKDAVIGVILTLEEYQKLLPRPITDTDKQNGLNMIKWLEEQHKQSKKKKKKLPLLDVVEKI